MEKNDRHNTKGELYIRIGSDLGRNLLQMRQHKLFIMWGLEGVRDTNQRVKLQIGKVLAFSVS